MKMGSSKLIRRMPSGITSKSMHMLAVIAIMMVIAEHVDVLTVILVTDLSDKNRCCDLPR